MEAYSKALNGGQFPLSVLALSESATSIYRTGLYGNTMTTNPRGLDVAMSVLDSFTPELRENIRRQGKALVAGLALPVTAVQILWVNLVTVSTLGLALAFTLDLAAGAASHRQTEPVS